MWSLGFWVVKAIWWEQTNFPDVLENHFIVSGPLLMPWNLHVEGIKEISDKTCLQEIQSEGALRVQARKSEWVWLPIKERTPSSWPLQKEIFLLPQVIQWTSLSNALDLSAEVVVVTRWPTWLLIILFVPPRANFSFLGWSHYSFNLFRK